MNLSELLLGSGPFGQGAVALGLLLSIVGLSAILRRSRQRVFALLLMCSFLPLLFGTIGIFIGASDMDRRIEEAIRKVGASTEIAPQYHEIGYPLYIAIGASALPFLINVIGFLRSPRH